VSSKRKFPFAQAKRLPRRAVSAWCVYAAVIEQGVGKDLEVSDSTVESEPEAERDLEEQRIEIRRGRSVRFAEIEKETSSGAEQSTSGEEKDGTTGSTFTLSKFKFPQPPGHTWAGTFGKVASHPTHHRMLTLSQDTPLSLLHRQVQRRYIIEVHHLTWSTRTRLFCS